MDKERSTEWARVVNATVQVLQQQYELHPETGLVADFLVYNHDEKCYKPAQGKVLERESDGEFGYNACRSLSLIYPAICTWNTCSRVGQTSQSPTVLGFLQNARGCLVVKGRGQTAQNYLEQNLEEGFTLFKSLLLSGQPSQVRHYQRGQQWLLGRIQWQH